MEAPGFVHYFKGPTTTDGRCMSFCLWNSRAEARAAAGRPAHTQAAALTHEAYQSYTLEFHRVRRLAGAGFTFEPYDAPDEQPAPEPFPSGPLAPSPSARLTAVRRPRPADAASARGRPGRSADHVLLSCGRGDRDADPRTRSRVDPGAGADRRDMARTRPTTARDWRSRSASRPSAPTAPSPTSCSCSSIPAVLTLGRTSDPAHIRADAATLAAAASRSSGSSAAAR